MKDTADTTPLLTVQGLVKSYPARGTGLFSRQRVTILRDIDLTVGRGEVLGLVGESGSGKSTVGRALMGLLPRDTGAVTFDGQPLEEIGRLDLRRRMQIIFQDPYASLDPRRRVRAILSEALDVHGLATGAEREPRLRELMDLVGMNPTFLDRYPHEFSGGQRQRIGIARALTVHPEFIVADEAVSALDVSIQAQVLNLIADLREQTGISMLFISHDLSVVRFISDRVAVLYLGRVVEEGPADDVYFRPQHPYTAALISSEPSLNEKKERIHLTGEMPSPHAPPSGCAFRTRCPFAQPACAEAVPALRDRAPGRRVACIRDDIPELQK